MGTTFSGVNKVCYSEYIHNSKRHSATAVMNPAPTAKDTQNAGVWAFARTQYYANYAGICEVYWNTY